MARAMSAVCPQSAVRAGRRAPTRESMTASHTRPPTAVAEASTLGGAGVTDAELRSVALNLPSRVRCSTTAWCSTRTGGPERLADNLATPLSAGVLAQVEAD